MHFAIIAAGEGSRLAQEGVALPKPLVELNGKPMIRRLIDIFMDCGAESISLIVNQEMVAVQKYVQSLHDSELRYEVDEIAAPGNAERFRARLYINGRLYSEGTGQSKKNAEQNAAVTACRILNISNVS